MSLLRSVRSRQILNYHLVFFTITKLFSHSGLISKPLYLEIIPWASITSNSYLNLSFIAIRILLEGFWTGIAFCLMVMCTGLHLKWPIPEKREAYLGWLIIACFVNVSIVNSWVVEFTMSVPAHIAELTLECMACFVDVSIVNSQGVEFTMPLPVPVCTVELAIGCMESTLLVKLLCQSVYMGQWNEVNPNAKVSPTLRLVSVYLILYRKAHVSP